MKYTDNALDEIVNLEREVFSLKAQNAILLKKYKMAQRDASTQDRLVEYNNLVVDSIPFLANISLSQPTAPSISDPEEAVLVCSCWHIGEVVKANDMGGMNEYNMYIFVRRLQQLVDKTVGIVAPLQKSRGLKTLHLIHTGDAVGGIIHSELTESNDLNIVEQAQSIPIFISNPNFFLDIKIKSFNASKTSVSLIVASNAPSSFTFLFLSFLVARE